MKRKRWLWVWITAAAVLATVLGWALTKTAEGSRGILYHVTGGQSDMYLLGSIHVGSRAMYPFGSDIEQAMAAADTFVYECDTTSADAVAQAQARMKLGDGLTLQGEIGPALYAQLAQVCQTTGLSIQTLEALKPWAVINTLAVYTTAAEMGSTNASDALALGVERQVQAYAARHTKQTAYLETLTQQMDALEGFSPELQTYLLANECDVILNPQSVKGMDATISLWPEWWRTGDAQSFADHYLSTYLEPGHEDVCREYHEVLVSSRNVRLADALDGLLHTGGTYFVTVGLLHLTLPEDSIVVQLQQKGYTVLQVAEP